MGAIIRSDRESDAVRTNIITIIGGLARIIRYQWATMLLIFIGIACLAGVYAAVARPQYNATATLVVESSRSPTSQSTQTPADAATESANIETLAEVARSEAIATAVVDKLELYNDPEFIGRDPNSETEESIIKGILRPLMASVKVLLGRKELSENDLHKQAVNSLRETLRVRRVALTYVIEISASSSDPRKAANIANTAALEFVKFQLESSSLAAKSAGVWLEARLVELRAEAEATEAAISNFRASGDPGSEPQERATLRELATRAQTYRSLYDAFLARAATMQQAEVPIPDARMVSVATAPLEPSFPRPGLVLPIGIAFGILAAGICGWLKERGQEKVRSAADVKRLVNSDFLGSAVVGNLYLDREADSVSKALQGQFLLPSGARVSVQQPQSELAAIIRNMRVAIDASGWDRESKVIGIVSACAAEGKTLVAANLAQAIAASGSKVLLVDANAPYPTLTTLLTSAGSHSCPNSAVGTERIHDLALYADHENLAFLPNYIDRRDVGPSTSIPSRQMRDLLKEARSMFDYVIVDLPAITGQPDVRALSSSIDHFVLLIRSNSSAQHKVAEALEMVPQIRPLLVGTILTR
ncbi:AAA family ATPase [Microvirga soli]|uniref:AAA family ATPase n=1 Tax=Microvirga soli TaxID=1854496 RepID=UPI00191F7DAA|nr:AAA family ATPase [Microvirga soli]